MKCVGTSGWCSVWVRVQCVGEGEGDSEVCGYIRLVQCVGEGEGTLCTTMIYLNTLTTPSNMVDFMSESKMCGYIIHQHNLSKPFDLTVQYGMTRPG